MKRRGFLIVLSGPSSAGKSTLLDMVLKMDAELCYSVSATTRSPRAGEKHGVDYFFHTEEHFMKMAGEGALLEWANYCGNWYGTPRQYVMEAIAEGKTVITDVNIDGARQLRRTLPEGVFVFLMPPSLGELRKRIVARGADSEESMNMRLAAAAEEISAVVDYDYCILNDDLEKAARQLLAIIWAERCRVSRMEFPAVL